MTYKFKIGDRVRVTDTMDAEYGKTGVVIENSANPWVCFDEQTKYGGDANRMKGWVAGRMDCIAEVYLELSSPESPLNEACAKYQSACAAFEQAQEALERAKQAVADARIDIGRALEREP